MTNLGDGQLIITDVGFTPADIGLGHHIRVIVAHVAIGDLR